MYHTQNLNVITYSYVHDDDDKQTISMDGWAQ